MKEEVLKLIGVNTEDYKYGGIIDASLILYKGETLALAGLYNSGKKTLIRILRGALPNYKGSIYINGKEALINSRVAARKYGIASIGENRLLFDNMSVLDNAYIVEAGKKFLSIINKKSSRKNARKYFDLFDIDISHKHYYMLSDFEKMKLEIMKVFIGGAKIMVFSDISMCCNKEEARILSKIIKKLNTYGVSVILDSDDYFDLFEDTIDTCTVVRRGIVTTTVFKSDGHFDKDALNHIIQGKRLQETSPNTVRPHFSKEDHKFFTMRDKTTSMSVHARRGSFIGIYDPNASIPRTIEGLVELLNKKYELFFKGKRMEIKNIHDLVEKRIAVIAKEAENRLVFENLSPVENVCFLAQPLSGKRIVYDRYISEYIFKSVIKKYEILKNCIVMKNYNNCYELSYEQQYEIMVAKWLAINPLVVVVFSPEYDKKNAERYNKLMENLSEEGKILIVISPNHDYLSPICTTILEYRC